MSLVYIRDKNGNLTPVPYVAVKGADGRTPVKGADYWTDADKAEIVQEVSEEIGSGGGSGGSAFYVTITSENGSYAANKTVAEITEAYEAGKPVYSIVQFDGELDGVTFILALRGIMGDMALFSGVMEAREYIAVIADDLTNVESMAFIDLVDIPTELPSPGKLTFNGAVSGSYNGSGDVTITIPTGSGEPGKDGADGHSPVKGVDYWTPEDREQIVQEVITALGTPVFGTVDENNNIILTGALADGTYTLKYEDAEGNVTTIGTFDSSGGSGDDPVSGYTNQIPISTDTDGSIYNGTGYKANSRCNSSGDIADCTGGTNNPFVTGFIPCKQGDVIRLKNCYMYAHGGGEEFKAVYGQDAFGVRSGLYDASKTMIAVESWGNLNGYTGANMTDKFSDYTRVDSTDGYDGKIYAFTIAYAGTAYIRLTLAADVDNGFTPADAIVTVNQEIN